MRSVRITLSVAAADEDAAALVLLDEGLPFEQRDAATLDRPADAATVDLSVYAAPEAVEATRARIERLFADAGVASRRCAVEEIDEASYRDAWKAHFRARPVGPFVLVPSWERYEARGGETVIELDPGRAFGTGGHASTRLCLRALGDAPRCERFLDVGCGSGVLAIAAARRWPGSRGRAIDVDPEAVDVTRENAETNGVAARVEASTTPLAAVDGRFDVVFANLTAETIIENAAALAARVAPGGRLLASGVLTEQARAVVDALAVAGLALVGDPLVEDEWSGLVLAPR